MLALAFRRRGNLRTNCFMVTYFYDHHLPASPPFPLRYHGIGLRSSQLELLVPNLLG